MTIIKKFINEVKCNVKEFSLDGDIGSFKVVQVLPVVPLEKLFICFHGYESSLQEWLDIDGYTKGGNLLKELVNNGCGFLLFDAYKHGTNVASDEVIDYDSALDEDEFYFPYVEKTVNCSEVIYNYIKMNPDFAEIPVSTMSYSFGSLMATSFMNQHPTINTAVQMVPVTFRGEEEEPYAPTTEMGNIANVPFLFIFATEDEESSHDDYLWFYNEVKLDNKQQLSFKSGHSLPIDYVEKVKEWVIKA